ncbi:MAG: hypothetical protein ACKO5R_13770 [Planctomycetaceae bacterium]
MEPRGITPPGQTPRPSAGVPWIRPLLGRADEARAELWVRCPPPSGATDAAGPLEAAGTLTGPRCATAATLPASFPLVDQGHLPGRAPLLRAVCTEPGYWTPDLPCLYDATVELRRAGRVVAAGTRAVGFRRAGTRGGSIRLDGHRFVPRAVRSRGDPAALEGLRESCRAALVDADDLGDEALATADRAGVALIVACAQPDGATAETLADRLEALAAHPAVLVAILDHDAPAGGAARVAAALGRRHGSMLLALGADAAATPPPSPPGFDLLVARLAPGAVPHDGWRRAAAVPCMAHETASAGMPVAAARAACDALQARLAAWAAARPAPGPFDWAGYLIG